MTRQHHIDATTVDRSPNKPGALDKRFTATLAECRERAAEGVAVDGSADLDKASGAEVVG
jgi:hypothetical protein